MRKTILAAGAALTLAGATAGTLIARAAPPPPPPGPGMEAGGPMHGPGPWHHRFGHWGHRGPHRPGLVRPGTFALLFHPADRQISAADATAIATGFLRWNGNHSWKVVDVKPTGDGQIGFAYATADGGVIARFTIDSHTGRIARVG
ncbi:MAG: hypothetical protein KGI51_13755 [Rhodospirillales bacterium]|nr:hypothetical protein [Rhodospirillales bacterium]